MKMDVNRKPTAPLRNPEPLFDSDVDLDQMKVMDWYRRHLHDAEGIAPDTYGCEAAFLYGFLTDEMDSDFAHIAHDFLKHRAGDLCLEQKKKYLPEDDGAFAPDEIMQFSLLNLMYSDAKSGNEYSRELFRTLYRTYYRREYQQLKRFRTLSAEEAVALLDKDPVKMLGLARILTIAGLFRIEIKPDCSYLYYVLNRFWKKTAESWDPTRWERYDHELFTACHQQAEEWMENVHQPYYKAKELQAYREVLDVMGQFLENEEFPGDYAAICRMHEGDYVDEFTGTLYGLRRRWPQRELPSFEEVQRHTALYQCVQALVDTSMHVTELFTECLAPHNPESGWTVCAGMFHPEKMKWSAGSKPAAPAPLQPAVPHTPKEEADEEADLQTVREELDRLRMQLRQKEEEIKHLHNQLAGQKRALQEAQQENQKNAENREELISLRDHVYRSTEQDEAPAAVSPEEMERVIAARRIVIIGGHSNWTYKLKNRFRKWVFLDPKVSGSTDGNLLNKADRVFFFTDIISHSTYYRFINLVREREIPFGYIHSINIESNIRQIYEETEDRKA